MSKFIGCVDNFEDAKVVVFGAPFDCTSSFRPGSRFAPEVMRKESWGLETYSPYQDKELADVGLYDAGDLELPFGNAKKALKQIRQYAENVINDGKKPVMIGGEHLMTLGVFEAVCEKHNNVSIVHFDAHTDLRDEYLGEKLSHATVMRRIYDIVGDGRIYQFGIRSGEKDEFEFAGRTGFINKFNLNGIDGVIEKLKDKPVYITLDLDVLDPSVVPGTGTPEPGGVTFMELLSAIVKLSGLNVVGFDIVELAPDYDRSGISTAAACKIWREMLLAFFCK